MEPFPIIRIAHVQSQETSASWLVEGLWADQAVGFIASTPKSGKTWLALEMAVAVASGRPCLGIYRVPRRGHVLLYAAEDSAEAIKQRTTAIAAVRRVGDLERLPIGLISEPQLRLDSLQHQQRLEATIAKIRPRLLILDPFIRIHRCDENSAAEVSRLLDYLRQLQRQHELAIVLVHHIRKSPAMQPGQALRGSGDLHAWADSALYLLRNNGRILLHAEHRAMPAPQPFGIELKTEPQPHLCVTKEGGLTEDPLEERVLDVLAEKGMTRTSLRDQLRVRNERLGQTLATLEADGRISRHDGLLIVPIPTT